MSPALRIAAALYAQAELDRDIADQFDGTGEAFFDKLVQGYRESARLATSQADRITLSTIKERTK